MAGVFKTSADRPREQTADGEIAPAVGPADGVCGHRRRRGDVRARQGARVPHAPGAGRGDLRARGPHRAVDRGRKQELGVGDVAVIQAGVVHATFNDGDVPARILAVLSPCVGESGYGAVDVSGEEPWRSLR